MIDQNIMTFNAFVIKNTTINVSNLNTNFIYNHVTLRLGPCVCTGASQESTCVTC